MSIYKKIGHQIKELREKTGMSQDRLSQKMGISRPAVSQIESGERKISADELQKLSHIFHVSVDDLLDPIKEPEVYLHKAKEEKASKPKMRISVPQKNL
ncbi:MAG: helix-turn-helix transcriptional regulator, partial [Nitrospirae bacterium]|nr:helix-turn-helix transcriptional regulator [Nitrospirota bacterium]